MCIGWDVHSFLGTWVGYLPGPRRCVGIDGGAWAPTAVRGHRRRCGGADGGAWAPSGTISAHAALTQCTWLSLHSDKFTGTVHALASLMQCMWHLDHNQRTGATPDFAARFSRPGAGPEPARTIPCPA